MASSVCAGRESGKQCVKADSPTPACLIKKVTLRSDGFRRRGSEGRNGTGFAAEMAKPCLRQDDSLKRSPRVE